MIATPQDRLFFEDLNDALRDVVARLGGAKCVGRLLWPEKSVEAAHSLLLACLNPARPEHLTPEQLLLLLCRGREAGCHSAMHFIADAAGYERAAPLNVEDESARIRAQFVASVKHLDTLTARLQEIEGFSGVMRAVR